MVILWNNNQHSDSNFANKKLKPIAFTEVGNRRFVLLGKGENKQLVSFGRVVTVHAISFCSLRRTSSTTILRARVGEFFFHPLPGERRVSFRFVSEACVLV